MYRIRLIIAQWKCSYPGELMPNVVDAWDDYVLQDNWDGYEEALKSHRDRVGTDYEWVRELDVQVPESVVSALAFVPSVAATWKAV